MSIMFLCCLFIPLNTLNYFTVYFLPFTFLSVFVVSPPRLIDTSAPPGSVYSSFGTSAPPGSVSSFFHVPFGTSAPPGLMPFLIARFLVGTSKYFSPAGLSVATFICSLALQLSWAQCLYLFTLLRASLSSIFEKTCCCLRGITIVVCGGFYVVLRASLSPIFGSIFCCPRRVLDRISVVLRASQSLFLWRFYLVVRASLSLSFWRFYVVLRASLSPIFVSNFCCLKGVTTAVFVEDSMLSYGRHYRRFLDRTSVALRASLLWASLSSTFGSIFWCHKAVTLDQISVVSRASLSLFLKILCCVKGAAIAVLKRFYVVLRASLPPIFESNFCCLKGVSLSLSLWRFYVVWRACHYRCLFEDSILS